jgi:hypothetical protein
MVLGIGEIEDSWIHQDIFATGEAGAMRSGPGRGQTLSAVVVVAQ